MTRKTKFVVGIALMVQAVSFIALFFAMYSKKKSLANTLLTLAAVGSIAGGWLLISSHEETSAHKKSLTMDACCDMDGISDDIFDEDFDEDILQVPARDE